MEFLWLGLNCILAPYSVMSAMTGRAEGVMYEDDNDGFGYLDGNYLMTYYEAEQLPVGNGSQAGGEVVVRVAQTEGHRQRPNRTLCVRLLLGHSTQVLNGIHLHGTSSQL